MPRRRYRRRFRRRSRLLRHVRRVAAGVAKRTALLAGAVPKISLWQSYSLDPTLQNTFPSLEQTDGGTYWYTPWNAIGYNADERVTYERAGAKILVTRFEIHFYVDGERWHESAPFDALNENSEVGFRLTVFMDKSGGRGSGLSWPYKLSGADIPSDQPPITAGGHINDYWLGGPTKPVGYWLRVMEDMRVLRDRWWRIRQKPTGGADSSTGNATVVDRAYSRFDFYKKWVWKFRRGLTVTFKEDNSSGEPNHNQLLIKAMFGNDSQEMCIVCKTYYRDLGY